VWTSRAAVDDPTQTLAVGPEAMQHPLHGQAIHSLACGLRKKRPGDVGIVGFCLIFRRARVSLITAWLQVRVLPGPPIVFGVRTLSSSSITSRRIIGRPL
jgi:hypothetical protein